MDGNYAIVGAYQDDDGGDNSGSAYIIKFAEGGGEFIVSSTYNTAEGEKVLTLDPVTSSDIVNLLVTELQGSNIPNTLDISEITVDAGTNLIIIGPSNYARMAYDFSYTGTVETAGGAITIDNDFQLPVPATTKEELYTALKERLILNDKILNVVNDESEDHLYLIKGLEGENEGTEMGDIRIIGGTYPVEETITTTTTAEISDNGKIEVASDASNLTTNNFIYIYDKQGVLRAKLPISEVGDGEASSIKLSSNDSGD